VVVRERNTMALPAKTALLEY